MNEPSITVELTGFEYTVNSLTFVRDLFGEFRDHL